MIDGSRRQRIARGSGTTVQQVNKLLSARKQMEKMMKQMGKGKLPEPPARRLRRSRQRHGGDMAVRMRLTRVGFEEEPDLPRRRRRLALAARRQVHRDRRALQPADRPVDDRVRRGQGQGVARQGRTADRDGVALLKVKNSLAELLDVSRAAPRRRSGRGPRRRGGAGGRRRAAPARREGGRRQGDRPPGTDRASAPRDRARRRARGSDAG